MSSEPIDLWDAVVRAVYARVQDGEDGTAWREAQPLIVAQAKNPKVAVALAGLIHAGAFSLEQRQNVARASFAAHKNDLELLGALGSAAEQLVEIDYLNAAPPEDSLFTELVAQLQRALEGKLEPERERAAVRGLATVARMLGRRFDDVAERAHLRAVEVQPERASERYNLGLFYKTRGRFKDGVVANLRAAELAEAPEESTYWNLGICATGAGNGEQAVRAWKALGIETLLGPSGLPEGRYAMVKVRVAERPLAERGAEQDDPGLEETIWIQRLSPCHGIVRSALYSDLGVDFGDVILFDGAPITEHVYGERRVPVFPHLATLKRPGYRIFRFAGTQEQAKQIGGLSSQFDGEIVLYVHTEQVRTLCASCWTSESHDRSAHVDEEKKVVIGKLCGPPSVSAKDLLHAIDGAAKNEPAVRIYAPDLCRAAGEDARAQIEERRFNMVFEATGGS